MGLAQSCPATRSGELTSITAAIDLTDSGVHPKAESRSGQPSSPEDLDIVGMRINPERQSSDVCNVAPGGFKGPGSPNEGTGLFGLMTTTSLIGHRLALSEVSPGQSEGIEECAEGDAASDDPPRPIGHVARVVDPVGVTPTVTVRGRCRGSGGSGGSGPTPSARRCHCNCGRSRGAVPVMIRCRRCDDSLGCRCRCRCSTSGARHDVGYLDRTGPPMERGWMVLVGG
jgi:hypothetical protein